MRLAAASGSIASFVWKEARNLFVLLVVYLMLAWSWQVGWTCVTCTTKLLTQWWLLLLLGSEGLFANTSTRVSQFTQAIILIGSLHDLYFGQRWSFCSVGSTFVLLVQPSWNRTHSLLQEIQWAILHNHPKKLEDKCNNLVDTMPQCWHLIWLAC